MADFVSNFLDGLRERRQREDMQSAKAEQVRQFQQQQAQHMFEFNANKALANKQFEFNRQQAERQQKRQDFQDTLSIADLVSSGKADQAIEGVDEFAGGQTVESPTTGQRIRLLTPEEQATRKFQLDMGLAKNKIDQGIQMIGEIGGEDARSEAEKLFKDPKVLADVVFGVKLGNQPAIPQNFQAAIIRDTEQKVTSGEISRQDATKVYQKLYTQGQASEVQRILGAMGGVAPQESIQQQDVTAADIIRDIAPGLAGMSIDEIVANKEDAIKQVRGGILDAAESNTGPFNPASSVRLDKDLIRSRAASIARRIVEDIIQLNKKPAGKTSILGEIGKAVGTQPGSNLTPEQRKNLGFK